MIYHDLYMLTECKEKCELDPTGDVKMKAQGDRFCEMISKGGHNVTIGIMSGKRRTNEDCFP